MPERELDFDLTFRDFQFLQGYMARRIFAKHRLQRGFALLGVVLCGVLLGTAIMVNVRPYRALAFSSQALPYPLSFYVLLIVILIAAIFALIPAVRLRLKMLRMQVSDDGPLLGATKLRVEEDGIAIDRGLMKAKYLWGALQGVEIAKKALVLPIDNGIGLIIPAAAFASDAERYEFAAAIAKRLEKQPHIAALSPRSPFPP